MKYFIIALILMLFGVCGRTHGETFKVDGVTIEYNTYREKEVIMIYKSILEEVWLTKCNIPGNHRNTPYTYWDLLKCATKIKWSENISFLAITQCENWDSDTGKWKSITVTFNKRLLKECALYYSVARVAAHEGVHAFIGKYSPSYRGDEEQFALPYTELFQRTLCDQLGRSYDYEEDNWSRIKCDMWN
jgi:hypothetical protein